MPSRPGVQLWPVGDDMALHGRRSVLDIAAIVYTAVAFCAGVVAVGWQGWTLRSSLEAQRLFSNVNAWLETDQALAFTAVLRANELFPWNAEYRRNALVAPARMAELGRIVDIKLMTDAYALAVSGIGYDQNVLVGWLDYLGHAQLYGTDAYKSALDRLERVNPRLAEYWQFTALRAGWLGDREGMIFAAEAMQNYAVLGSQREIADQLLAVARGP